MKLRSLLPVCALALVATLSAAAQAPAGAPAGATGMCKDGTYSNQASKSGACSGHKGVQQWYSETAKTAKASAKAPAASPAPAATPAVAAKPAPTPAAAAPASMPAPTPAAKSTTRSIPAPAAAAAPGGGPGQVWVNTSTKVYHCPGDRYYGKTKAGKYMSESDAKAAGFKADAGKACSK